MALKVKIIDSPYFDTEVILSTTTYSLLFKYNTSDESWYITVRDSNKTIITSGIKVMPNQNLTLNRQYNGVMDGGNLWCIRTKKDESPISRDNFGVGKTYELWWITNDEEATGGLDGVIQL